MDRIVDLIRSKRDGEELSFDDYERLISAYARGEVTEYQMAALLMAQATGSGEHVDVSAMEAMAGNVDNRPLYYEYSGLKSERGNWPGGYPQGAYPCSDGYVLTSPHRTASYGSERTCCRRSITLTGRLPDRNCGHCYEKLI